MPSHATTGRGATPRAAARLLALGAGGFLVGALALVPPALAATAAGAPYTDVSATNADAAPIEFLTAEGVLNGYPDHTFRPDTTITRAEFAKAVVSLLGPKAQAAARALANTTPQFADAAQIPTWAWGYVNYAQGQNIVTGYPDHTFRANGDVTMVEASAMLLRAIGDTAAVPSGTWPSNYTLAAYNLNVANEVQFVANLPATRGEVAQMAYNAALLAPTLQNGYTSGTPTGVPLYLGGDGFTQSAWVGTVAGVTSSSITLSNASGTQILTAPLAESYYLAGTADVTSLQGLQATVATDAAGQIDFVQAQAGAQSKGGTLATSSVATPAGYARLSDFLVQSGGSYALLLADGSMLPVVSTTSSGGTKYYVNAPTAGASADTASLVAGVGNLADGDAVTVTMASSGQAIAVYAVHDTIALGLVQAVNTSTNTLTYTTGDHEQTTGTSTVQAWTSVTLNGAASSLADLQKGDVVDVQIVGNGSGGDTNARQVAATRQSVSGTVSSVTTQTGASGTTVQIGLSESNGQTTTVTTDSSFDSGGMSISVGNAVMLALDAQGQARLAQSLSPQETVVLVEEVQTSSSYQNGSIVTTRQIVTNNQGQTVTYDLAAGAPNPLQAGPNGYLAVITFQAGTIEVSQVSPLSEVGAGQNLTFKVVSDDGNYILVQEYNAADQAQGNPLVVSKGAGAVVYSGKTFEAFGSVAAGTDVSLWSNGSGGAYLGVFE